MTNSSLGVIVLLIVVIIAFAIPGKAGADKGHDRGPDGGK